MLVVVVVAVVVVEVVVVATATVAIVLVLLIYKVPLHGWLWIAGKGDNASGWQHKQKIKVKCAWTVAIGFIACYPP